MAPEGEPMDLGRSRIIYLVHLPLKKYPYGPRWYPGATLVLNG